jgi:hypothetical protein
LFARFTSDSQANVAEAGNGFSGLRKPEGSFRGTPSSIVMENWDVLIIHPFHILNTWKLWFNKGFAPFWNKGCLISG